MRDDVARSQYESAQKTLHAYFSQVASHNFITETSARSQENGPRTSFTLVVNDKYPLHVSVGIDLNDINDPDDDEVYCSVVDMEQVGQERWPLVFSKRMENFGEIKTFLGIPYSGTRTEEVTDIHAAAVTDVPPCGKNLHDAVTTWKGLSGNNVPPPRLTAEETGCSVKTEHRQGPFLRTAKPSIF